MKKLLLVLTFFLVFSLSACGKDETADENTKSDDPKVVDDNDEDETNTLIAVKGILTDAGYELEQRDQESIDYFQENRVNNLYGLSVTITDLYVGYLNGGSWIELVEMSSESEAIAYETSLSETGEGYLLYRSGTTVLYTFSEDTYALFD